MIDKQFLHALMSAPSPSGFESPCVELFDRHLAGWARKEYSDNTGNSVFSIGSDNAPIKIMISAHIDEIAMLVQNIDDKGFIHFVGDGGVDKKTLPGSRVKIITSNGYVYGVIGKAPIHVEKGEERNKVMEIKDMKIDIGVESKESAAALVSIGDPILVDVEPVDIGEHRVTGRGLDDKAGIFVVGEVVKELYRHNLKKVKVYAVACTQEETTASGAIISGANINPDYSIDFDVTFATDDGHVDANDWGDIKLGKGGAIAHGTNCFPPLVKLIKEECVDKGIPFQEFVAPDCGTDTIYIKQASSNAKTTLLSIPNRNMHTATEVCDYRDLQSLVDMTVAAILRIDKEG